MASRYREPPYLPQTRSYVRRLVMNLRLSECVSFLGLERCEDMKHFDLHSKLEGMHRLNHLAFRSCEMLTRIYMGKKDEHIFTLQ